MSLYYHHLLIPTRPDFVPKPGQVAAFYDELVRHESAPLAASFQLSELTGESDTFGPQGLRPITIPRRKSSRLGSVSEVIERLIQLDSYQLSLWGDGPPNRPPFAVYAFEGKTKVESQFKGKYGYHVDCELREAIVASTGRFFGEPDPPERGPARFQNPRTGLKIEVANATCMRFSIEFVVGKFLWPMIKDSFELIDPSILAVATEQFGIEFAQAGRYN